MLQESPNPNERLEQAATDLRGQNLSPYVLERAESAIANRLAQPRRAPLRWLWAAGFGTAALAGAMLMVPSESPASELMRIAKNGDGILHHMRQYQVNPNGSKNLILDVFALGDQTRGTYGTTGEQFASTGDRFSILHQDGATTVERRSGPNARKMQYSAEQIIANNVSKRGLKVQTDKGVSWNGMSVDRYKITGKFVDGRGQNVEVRATLYAERERQLPLEFDTELVGIGTFASVWDYPAYNEKIFRLPGTDPSRVYDQEASRQQVISRLRAPGRKAVVDGQTVELSDLWVDEEGDACAIIKANYAYPYEYGIKVEGLELCPPPTAPPFFTGSEVVQPSTFEGQPTHLFHAGRDAAAPKVQYPDKVTLLVPVFKGKSLRGYARFANVPVHRAWKLLFLLWPRNQPFWLDK